MDGSYDDWHRAYVNTLGPHTPVDTLARNEAQKAAGAVIRLFVNRYMRFPPVTNEDRSATGISNHSGGRSPVGKPSAQAEADLVFPGIHLVELRKIHPAGGASPDPRSDYGVRIFYGVLGGGKARERITEPPRTGGELPQSIFTRRKTYRFDFDGDSGKAVYFCLRYENSKGGEEGEGPFGPILSAFIP
jgi:hypothetical protein